MNKVAQDLERQGFFFDLRGAFLRRTDLSHTVLKRANLSRADFANATFRAADFENAILDGTNLSGADLTDARFFGTDFTGAVLDGAILKGADLSGARNLTPAQLRTAVLDERTKLPPDISFPARLGSEG
jgi:uncharacterized protein YjbI with pentapeptide repeats